MPTDTRSPATLLAFSLAALVVMGCGHPASREECEAIFMKSATVELKAQSITDEKVIAERMATAREKAGGVIEACIGRRITDGALQCLQAASTSDEIDRCLD